VFLSILLHFSFRPLSPGAGYHRDEQHWKLQGAFLREMEPKAAARQQAAEFKAECQCYIFIANNLSASSKPSRRGLGTAFFKKQPLALRLRKN
jgi:hypothetical protein